MNRLIRILGLFVLPIFSLLFSVSYAEIEPNVEYRGWFDYSESSYSSVGSYSSTAIISALSDFNNGSTETLTTMMNDLISTNIISSWYVGKRIDNNYNILIMVPYGIDSELFYCSSDSKFYLGFPNVTVNDYFYMVFGSKLYRNKARNTNGPIYSTGTNFTYFSKSVKSLITPPGSSGIFSWDGSSYYYKIGGDGSDTPSLPSNAEIAQAVQAFYNSDYYKNNTEFDDFMVMYNYKTQYFSFVGHNFGSDLGQVIVPPEYEYEGYSYHQDWWKFFLRNISSEIASNLWNRYYWLYSTNDFGENITYDGKGAIKDILNIHWATSSIIVYSTTDYPVVKIETDENGVLTPVQGTVPGDQYTYDENLDPTTNEYNPLENFVPINPSQSILGDVDFNEINKVFEENKDILNIENASWLFSANNQLVTYFLGFLLLLIVFLIISRVLGG